jgi:hypothetical protein
MTDFVDRFEAQLLAARPSRRRRQRPRLAVLTALCLTVAAPAIAATQPWRPLLGDHRRGEPSVSASAIPEAELERFGVLRREQTNLDRGPATQSALRYLDRDVSGVHTDGIRLLSESPLSAVLVPVAKFNVHGDERARNLPQRLRSVVSPKSDGLCVFVADPAGHGGSLSCATLAELTAGRLPDSMGPVLYGLVPDGVFTVSLRLADGNTVEAPVRANFYAVAATPGGDRRSAPAVDEIRWQTADNRTVHIVMAAK